ncbi:MAG: DUF2203 domain-containing protein [Solirubrobacteraceae bacterium]
MRHERHWSVEEANALRPYVGACVRRLREARGWLAGRPVPPAAGALAMISGGAWPGREHAEAAVDVVLTLGQLDRLEVLVRDLDAGLVDFPALRDGEEVYLCWLVDEPEVRHWHAPGAGFPARRPL